MVDFDINITEFEFKRYIRTILKVKIGMFEKDITDDYEDLVLDSLDAIIIIASIEKDYNVKFNDEDLLNSKILSIQDMWDYIMPISKIRRKKLEEIEKNKI